MKKNNGSRNTKEKINNQPNLCKKRKLRINLNAIYVWNGLLILYFYHVSIQHVIIVLYKYLGMTRAAQTAEEKLMNYLNSLFDSFEGFYNINT